MINRICRVLFFKMLGWQQIGTLPTEKKYLFVVLPHTSNWDFVYGWLAIRALDLKVTIYAKDVFFVWPLNYICKFFGVAPINRRKRSNFVDSIARQYEEQDELAALITPEGTRKYQAELKSGYYYLAKKANIPIVLAGPNFKNKSFTVLPSRDPMPSFEEDVAKLIEFCKTQHARWPEQSFR